MCDHGFNVARQQPERPTHDLDESAERRVLTVRRAITGQDPYAVLYDLPHEFMHEARLADAGFANGVEHVRTAGDRAEAGPDVPPVPRLRPAPIRASHSTCGSAAATPAKSSSIIAQVEDSGTGSRTFRDEDGP